MKFDGPTIKEATSGPVQTGFSARQRTKPLRNERDYLRLVAKIFRGKAHG